MGELFFSKIDKIDWKIFNLLNILLHNFFFDMFDLKLSQLPPLCPAHAFKES